MGAYLCFLFQLQEREINDKGGGGVSVSGVTQCIVGLVIIRDEA